MKLYSVLIFAAFALVFGAGVGIAAQSHPWSEIVTPFAQTIGIKGAGDGSSGILLQDTGGANRGYISQSDTGSTKTINIVSDIIRLNRLTSGTFQIHLNGPTVYFYTLNGATLLGSLWAEGPGGTWGKTLQVVFDTIHLNGITIGNFQPDSGAKLWGTGRPDVGLDGDGLTNCPSTEYGSGRSIIVNQGNMELPWYAAEHGCPAGYWVCRQQEKGATSCGLLSQWGWTADKSTANADSGVSARGSQNTYATDDEDTQYQVWCCRYA